MATLTTLAQFQVDKGLLMTGRQLMPFPQQLADSCDHVTCKDLITICITQYLGMQACNEVN